MAVEHDLLALLVAVAFCAAAERQLRAVEELCADPAGADPAAVRTLLEGARRHLVLAQLITGREEQ